MDKIILFLRQFGWIVIVGLIGCGTLIYGLWGQIVPQESVVEIIKGGNSDNLEIVIDVSGAVEKPGLYKLQNGSRIGDALVMAGGLSAGADREWVGKTINLAEILKDGGKVYIPEKNSASGGGGVNDSGLVNINTGTLGELDGLTGIGEVRAKTIMDNRPYSNVDELVSKAKIPESVVEKIKDQISVY